MTDPDEHLERRVDALEDDVGRLRDGVTRSREDAGAARVLAAGADHEVGDLRTEVRASRRLIQALRDTQLEHQDQLSVRINALESEMRRGFAEMRVGMGQIVTLLERDPEP